MDWHKVIWPLILTSNILIYIEKREVYANYVTKGHQICKLHLDVLWTMYMSFFPFVINQPFSPTTSLIDFVPFADDAFLSHFVILLHMKVLLQSTLF